MQRLVATLFLALLAVGQLAVAAGPEVTALLPAGGQRGTTVEVITSGKFPTWPVQSWIDREGLTIAPAEEKGKFNVTIAPEATPGTCWLRLFDSDGTSPPQPFVVGTLGEIVEKEPNNGHESAQLVGSAAVVVNGRLSRDDVDTFATTLEKGQTLVASLAAYETLGSPVDAVMHVVSPEGFQLAYNHDQRGLDPEIVFTAPSAGTYLVRVFGFPSAPNSTIGFAGGDAYVYRLTMTTAGFVDYPWPLAVTRDREARVELVGWNIPESLQSVTIHPTGDDAAIADAQLANVSALLVEPHETVVEAEPNEQARPQEIALPITISGRIERPLDADAFSFTGTKGQAIEFQLQSRALGYPLDAVLQIFDAEGKSLAKADDAGGGYDASLVFTPPADGTYVVVVTDLTRHGSPRHVYRLRAMPAAADFRVTANANAYEVTAEKPAEITVAVERQHGFAEEIQFSVSGLPEFIKADTPTSAASGDSAKSVKITLTSSGGAFSGPLRIEARSTGDKKLTRAATAAIPNVAAQISDLWLTATEAKQ